MTERIAGLYVLLLAGFSIGFLSGPFYIDHAATFLMFGFVVQAGLGGALMRSRD